MFSLSGDYPVYVQDTKIIKYSFTGCFNLFDMPVKFMSIILPHNFLIVIQDQEFLIIYYPVQDSLS